MNVFAASHAIDDGADHDDEINEDAAHAHEALRGGVHGAGDEFSHTVLLEKSGRPFRRAAGITVYLLPSPAKSQGGFPERLACSDGIRKGCAPFPRAQSLAGTRGRPGTRLPPREKEQIHPRSRLAAPAHHDGPTSRLIGCRAPPRKRPSGVLPRIPGFCLSSPSLL